MIQRVQTIYLLIVFLLLGVVATFFDLWILENNMSKSLLELLSEKSILLKLIPLLFYTSALLALIIIFLFKKRQLQFVLVRFNILINLFLLGLLIYLSLTLSGEAKVSEKGIGMFLPIIAILFLVFANKAIKKDEDLVKSVDRLR